MRLMNDEPVDLDRSAVRDRDVDGVTADNERTHPFVNGRLDPRFSAKVQIVAMQRDDHANFAPGASFCDERETGNCKIAKQDDVVAARTTEQGPAGTQEESKNDR